MKTMLTAGGKYIGDGSTYDTTNNRCISDHEGAGVLCSFNSHWCLAMSRYAVQTVSSSQEGQSFTTTFNTTTDDTLIRVSLSWLKRSELSDFDLRVYKVSNNQLVAYSLETDENLEVVKFNPNTYGVGQYRIEVKYFALPNTSDSFSLTWY